MAGVCPDERNVDEPAGCQGDSSDMQRKTFKEEFVWAHKGSGTSEGGGHSDAAKPVRPSTPMLGQEGFDQYQVMIEESRRLT
jgi:hypothetical protein